MMDRSLSFDSELLPKMKTLMILRVIVITTLLGGVIFFQMTVGQSPAILPVTILIATTYFLTIVYALSLYRVKQLRFFCYLQIGADLFIETGIIYTTGGVESIFSFLYILSIITASIVLQRRGSFAVASASSILYGTLANLELYRVVEPLSLYPRGIFPLEVEFSVFTILLHISAFFLVAFLSGYLSEKLKKTGEELKEKSGNLIELQAFHENIVQSLTSGLLTTDFGGKITSFNKAAEEITGYLLREVMEMPCSQLFPFLKSELVSDFSELTSSASRYEGRFQRKDGKECYLGMRVSPLRDELNDIRGLIYIFQDLTEIKEMEAQIRRAERLAAIGRIAAGIAHEIR
ncbi:MAG: PAS domain S-box protein, partial [Candidatus Tectomicrobia bacterium]|nr:PAS domain S-box protein [Candidatus Tectomicrobia bacterium]